MSSKESILKINNLTKKYGNNYAVKDLSFSIEKGNIYGILGPNGSGKSTTLGMVLNVVNPTSGSYEWFNNQLDTHNALKLVGAIIEHPNFYPNMTAHENLQLVSKIKQCGYENINNVLEIVELSDRQHDHFRTFSLGMKQRLAIASALLNKPEILILDEPTNGLDPKGIHQIRSIIQKIAETGTTILLASHLLDEVEKICSHVVVLRKGEKLYSGKVDEMNASFGFIEVSTDDNSFLVDAINELDFVKAIDQNQLTGIVKITLSREISASDFNLLCFEKGIVLNHLVKRKESLEEQFLQLTK